MKKQIAVLSLLISVMGWAQEEKPQTTIRGGDKNNKLTPDKLKEREEFLKKFPEFANDNVLANGIDGLEQSDVDTMSPALRPGY